MTLLEATSLEVGTALLETTSLEIETSEELGRALSEEIVLEASEELEGGIEVDVDMSEEVVVGVVVHVPTTEGTASLPLPIATNSDPQSSRVVLGPMCTSRLSQSKTTYAARRKVAPRTG